MAVYTYNGVQITDVYNLLGSSLEHAYDIGGNELLDVEPEKYSIENVIEYYRTPTLSVASEINELSDDWQSFVFITDPHGSGNKQHSQAIGMYLLDNTPAFMLLLGGDYSVGGWSKNEYTNYMRPFVNSDLIGNIYAILGNHERMGDGLAEAEECIYTDFLSNKTNLHGQLEQNYYYLDNAEKKTRFMFLNTSDGSGMYNMSAEQISWIGQNVVLPTDEWSLVVIGHVNLLKMAGVTVENENNGSSIVSAIENTNGTIVGYICGHQHIDYCEKLGNFQHTTINCDKFSNTNYYNGISITDRVAGTTSEQAVSVISINVITKQVVVRRVGAGRNSMFSYTY